METKKEVIEFIKSLAFIKNVEIKRNNNSNDCTIIIEAVDKGDAKQADLEKIMNQVKGIEEKNQIFNEKIMRLISQLNSIMNKNNELISIQNRPTTEFNILNDLDLNTSSNLDEKK